MNSKEMTKEQVAGMFDHTNLKPYAVHEDFEKLCTEAVEIHAAMVAINPVAVKLCKNLLAGTGIHIGAAISFPLGQTTIAEKVEETKLAIADGADEIDYVLNIGELLSGNHEYIKEEMEAIVTVCRSSKVISKVIFENCYLTKEQIRKAAEIAKEVKPDYVKTSTGFGDSGAMVEDVRLMKQVVGDSVKVKAAGGIRDWKTCAAMIDAGAERIGTSSCMEILDGYEKEKHSAK